MEALAAARAGNRVRARSLLTKLLKTDSSVVDYWVWVSSVVESQREKIYCLESALKLDPTNRAVLRGLALMGARVPTEAELPGAARIPRRQIAAIATGASIGGGVRLPRLPWRVMAYAVGAVVVIFAVGFIARAVIPFFWAETNVGRPDAAAANRTSVFDARDSHRDRHDNPRYLARPAHRNPN